jgi:hypothetical protein
MPDGSVPRLSDFSLRATVTGATEFLDGLAVPFGQTVFYRLRARDACINESDFSEEAEPTCPFDGRVQIREPLYGEVVAGSVDVTVEVEDASPPYERLVLTYHQHEPPGGTETREFPGPGPSWHDAWVVTGLPSATYAITASVEQLTGTVVCVQSRTIKVVVGESD